VHLHTLNKLRWFSFENARPDPFSNKGYRENIVKDASGKNIKLSAKGSTGG
jgi:hypothetical protein